MTKAGSTTPGDRPSLQGGHADVRARVCATQLDALAKLGAGSALLGLVAAGMLGVIFWPDGRHGYLVSIAALFLVTYGALLGHSNAWRVLRGRTSPPIRSMMWTRIALSAAIGMLWASVPVMLMPGADADKRLIIGNICAGLIATGPMLAPMLPAALMFSGSIVLGSLLALFMQQGPLVHLTMACMVGFGGFVTLSIFDHNRRFVDRVLANAQLEEQGEIISLLLRDFEESSSDWLWQTDSEGHLTGASEDFAQAVARSCGEAEGCGLVGWSVQGGRSGAARESFLRLAESLARPAAFRDIVVPLTVSADQRWFSLTGKPVFGRDHGFRGFRGVAADVTAARLSATRITYLASTDDLTDLPNRNTLAEVLVDTCARRHPFALLSLDLDGFKAVNDIVGHPAGDTVLVAAARRMRGCLREGDVLARLGGDEFAVVQAEGDQEGAERLARRLTERLSEPFSVDGVQVMVGASIGIALAPEDGSLPEHLLKAADLALHRAKHDGRGIWRFFDREMSMVVQLRQALQADLRQALLRNELTVHFQPIYELDDNRVVAMEALLRWRHPIRGAVPPAEFIPLAEEAGLIVAIGTWVLRAACAFAAQWDTPVRVAVNLSPVQIRDPDLLTVVDAALAAAALPAGRLELEITESLFLEATDATRARLYALRARGIRIALDDFGTGYSSLSYLRSFPFDKVKIDRSFVSDIGVDSNASAIVKAIVSMADSLGMTTLAEGIETEEQEGILRLLGCRLAQGFLFSRPVPAEAAARLLALDRDASTDVQANRPATLLVESACG